MEHVMPDRGRPRFLITLLLAFLYACSTAPKPSHDVATKALQAGDLQFVSAFIEPERFSTLQVRNDNSGKFTQIDDMRFRVNDFSTFGWSGSQWPFAALNYQLAPEVRNDPFRLAQFLAACQMLLLGSAAFCSDITDGEAHPGAVNHVYVINDDANYSYVGRVGGRQLLGIVNWNSVPIIAHELKHALGWVHEHQRPDRDQFIRIHWDNIEPDARHNFDIMGSVGAWPTYDFDSVMHYGERAFSSNGQITIEVLPPNQVWQTKIGQRARVSVNDRREIVGIYGDASTEWCGLFRKPKGTPPPQCIVDCIFRGDTGLGEWIICGCAGARICP